MEGIRKDDRAENNNNYGLSPVPAPFLESFRQCHCCRQGTCIVERKSQAGLLTYPSSQRLLTPWGNGFVLRQLAGHTAAGLFGIRTRFPVRRGRYARTCGSMLVCLRSKGRKHFFQSASLFSKDAAKLLLFFELTKYFRKKSTKKCIFVINRDSFTDEHETLSHRASICGAVSLILW